MTTIRFYRGANAPAVPILCVDANGTAIDLTASEVEVQIRAKIGATPVVLRTDDIDPSVVIVPPNGFTLAYDETLAGSLPLGKIAKWDAYRELDGAREKIGGGDILVLGSGQYDGSDGSVTVQVPGVQGPPGADGADGADGAPGTASPEFIAAHDEVMDVYDALTAAPDTISASTYTLVSDDLGKVKRFTNACVVTLPASLPAGWYCTLRRAGTGTLTWTAASGATKHEYPAGSGVAAQWASVVSTVDSNSGGSAAVWVIEGAIS